MIQSPRLAITETTTSFASSPTDKFRLQKGWVLGSRAVRGNVLAKTSQFHNTKSSEPPHEAHSSIVGPGSPAWLGEEIEGNCDLSSRLLCKAVELVVNEPPLGYVHGEVHISTEYRPGEDERNF